MTKIVRLAQIHDSTKTTPLEPSLQGGVVSIGNFDGVHRGHAALLAQVKQLAEKLDAPTIVVVFDPHPVAILRPEQIPPRLTWIQRRAELLDAVGIDFLLVCETTRDLLNLSAESFFQNLIVDRLKAKAMVEGPNFFFGHGRGGNVETLEKLCGENDMQLTIATPFTKSETNASDTNELDTNDSSSEQMVSSSRIRISLSESKIDEANEMLGTPYRIRGTVTKGSQRGSKIGFPTANLTNIDVVIPGHGVYGGIVHIDSKQHVAAIHVGPNPTFDDNEATKVEVHVLDYDGDLYDQSLLVDFVAHVRGVVRFESAQQLIDQLQKDISTIRSRMATFSSDGADTIPDQK